MNYKVTWIVALLGVLIGSKNIQNAALASALSTPKNLPHSTLNKNLLTSLPAISCNTNIAVGEEYACIVSGASQGARYSLKNAPTGMMIQPRSGYLHWTPASNQSGTQSATVVRTLDGQIEETSITFNVQAGTATLPNAIYLAPNGNDKNSGTIEEPLLSLHKAASIAKAGDTIYLRGGTYLNQGHGTNFIGRRSNLARITNSGEANNPITIRPYGNEYVKLKSDVNGIVFKGASHWRVQGIELQGNTQNDEKKSLSLWWDESDASNEIKGRGIAMNTSFYIEIEDCIVRDFPGAGVSNNGGANISLKDSVIYNNAWWSTAGTHGFANSKPATQNQSNQTDFKMTMTGNLVFGNQSSVISHVFSKGFVKLEIDEGNGLHMQNTEGLFYGRFLATNNLVMYNGKAGLGLNTIASSNISNNSFYQNAQAVDGSGEVSLQPPDANSGNIQANVITKNLFHPLADRQTIKVFDKGQSDLYAGISDNYTVPAQDADVIKNNVTFADSVFADPQNLNFNPASGISSDYGVPQNVLNSFAGKIEEYGLIIKPAKTKITDAYLKKMKLKIFRTWPAPNPDDSIPDNLILEDGDTGFCYTYEQRGDYPAPPKTPTPCK